MKSALLIRKISAATYVNGPVFLLHVVGSQEICDTSKLVKQVVLESEHWCGAHNSCLREDFTNNTLAPTFGLEELRWRVLGGIVRRNVDESVNVVFGDCLSDTLCTVNVDVLVGEVPAQLAFIQNHSRGDVLGRIVTADKVVNNVGMANALFNRLCVAKVVFLLWSASALSTASIVHTVKTTRPRSPETLR